MENQLDPRLHFAAWHRPFVWKRLFMRGPLHYEKFTVFHNNGGKVRPGKDLTEHAWVTLKEAKKYDLIDGIWMN